MGIGRAGVLGVTYLLDTNACVSYLRSRGLSAASVRIQDAKPGAISICSIVREELLFGALRSARATENRAEVERFLSVFPSLPFDDRAATICADIRDNLERAGSRIGFNDCMIASIALAHSLVLITHNSQEFARIPNLLLEDWERA